MGGLQGSCADCAVAADNVNPAIGCVGIAVAVMGSAGLERLYLWPHFDHLCRVTGTGPGLSLSDDIERLSPVLDCRVSTLVVSRRPILAGRLDKRVGRHWDSGAVFDVLP